MKKLLATAVAGAMLLSTTVAAFAFTKLENKNTDVTINATSFSDTGGNKQKGEGSNDMMTGNALSVTGVTSVANVNWLGDCGCLSDESSLILKNRHTNVDIYASATSKTGGNKQKAWEDGSSNTMVTGDAGSKTTVDSWANINLAGVEFSF